MERDTGAVDFSELKLSETGRIFELQKITNQHYEDQATKVIRLIIALFGLIITSLFYAFQADNFDFSKLTAYEQRATVIENTLPLIEPGGGLIVIGLVTMIVIGYIGFGIQSLLNALSAGVGVLNPEELSTGFDEELHSPIFESTILDSTDITELLTSHIEELKQNKRIVEKTRENWLKCYKHLKTSGQRFVVAATGAFPYLFNEEFAYLISLPLFFGLFGYRVWSGIPTSSLAEYAFLEPKADLFYSGVIAIIFSGTFLLPQTELIVIARTLLILILVIVTTVLVSELGWKDELDWHLRNGLFALAAFCAFFAYPIFDTIFKLPIAYQAFSNITVTVMFGMVILLASSAIFHGISLIGQYILTPLRSLVP